MDIDTTLGHKGDTSLGVSRLVFGKVFELVVLQLEVPDVTVAMIVSSVPAFTISFLPSTSKVQTPSTLIPERHTYARDGVERLKAVDRLPRSAHIPQSELAVAHF